MTDSPGAEMRAVVADTPGGPDVLRLRTVPRPEAGPGEVRVQVAYAALNPLDAHARAARIAWNAPGFPYTPGYEYSGLVDQAGDGVDPALVGRRVIVAGQWGGCAEYAIARAAGLVLVPEGFPWPLATVFHTCAFSAWHILHTAGRLREDDHVLLHSAAGAVALMATQIAKEAGATVYGLCSPDKIEFARPFGADHLIDTRRDDWPDEVLARSEGRGVDLVVDGVAGPHAHRNLDVLAPLGQVIYLGAMAGPSPPLDISGQLFAKSAAVRGFVVYHAMTATRGAERDAVHDALRTGRWRIPITRTVELEETADLHRDLEARALMGKALVRVGGDIGPNAPAPSGLAKAARSTSAGWFL